mmetsp:Transcript_80112/g.158703  ORF Transcript_80112/g.158703 Transcript_80112/m.158703 type:complete len:109 (-) Transcript_80112:240-566(-)
MKGCRQMSGVHTFFKIAHPGFKPLALFNALRSTWVVRWLLARSRFMVIRTTAINGSFHLGPVSKWTVQHYWTNLTPMAAWLPFLQPQHSLPGNRSEDMAIMEAVLLID